VVLDVEAGAVLVVAPVDDVGAVLGGCGLRHFEDFRLAHLALIFALVECARFLPVAGTCDAAARLIASVLTASTTSRAIERRRCTASQSARLRRPLTSRCQDWPKCPERQSCG
jgi:hypothetical protein